MAVGGNDDSRCTRTSAQANQDGTLPPLRSSLLARRASPPGRLSTRRPGRSRACGRMYRCGSSGPPACALPASGTAPGCARLSAAGTAGAPALAKGSVGCIRGTARPRRFLDAAQHDTHGANTSTSPVFRPGSFIRCRGRLTGGSVGASGQPGKQVRAWRPERGYRPVERWTADRQPVGRQPASDTP